MKVRSQSWWRGTALAALVGVAAAAALAGGVAARVSPAAVSAHAGKPTIYMVTHACPSDTFWPPVFNGAQLAANKLGVNLRIVRLTAAQCGSIPAEVDNFQTAVSAHPAGIIVTLPSATAFRSALQQAAAQHIPVVAINTIPSNSPTDNTAPNPYLSYVGQTNYSAGLGAASEAIHLFHLTKGAQVAVVDHEPFNISLTQREQGIAAGLRAVHITPVDVNTSDNPAQGATVVEAYLTKHSGVKALLTLGTIGTTQVVTALRQAGKVKHVDVGAFDLDSATLQYIRTGVVQFTVDQQPFLQGFYGVTELYLKHTLGAQPTDFFTGPAYLTSQNVGDVGRYVNQTGF